MKTIQLSDELQDMLQSLKQANQGAIVLDEKSGMKYFIQAVKENIEEMPFGNSYDSA